MRHAVSYQFHHCNKNILASDGWVDFEQQKGKMIRGLISTTYKKVFQLWFGSLSL